MGIRSFVTNELSGGLDNVANTLETVASVAAAKKEENERKDKALTDSINKTSIDRVTKGWQASADNWINEDLMYNPELINEKISSDGSSPLLDEFTDSLVSQVNENNMLSDEARTKVLEEYLPAFKQNLALDVNKLRIHAKNTKLQTDVDAYAELISSDPNVGAQEALTSFKQYLDDNTPWNDSYKNNLMNTFTETVMPNKALQMVKGGIDGHMFDDSYDVNALVDAAAKEMGLTEVQKDTLLKESYTYKDRADTIVRGKVQETCVSLNSEMFDQRSQNSMYDVNRIYQARDQFPKKFNYEFWRLEQTAYINNDFVIEDSLKGSLSQRKPLNGYEWGLIETIHDTDKKDILKNKALLNVGLTAYNANNSTGFSDGLKAINDPNLPVSEENREAARAQLAIITARNNGYQNDAMLEVLHNYNLEKGTLAKDTAIKSDTGAPQESQVVSAPEQEVVERPSPSQETQIKSEDIQEAVPEAQPSDMRIRGQQKVGKDIENEPVDPSLAAKTQEDQVTSQSTGTRITEETEKKKELSGEELIKKILDDAAQDNYPTAEDMKNFTPEVKEAIIDVVEKEASNEPTSSDPQVEVILYGMQGDESTPAPVLKQTVQAFHGAGLLTRDDANKFSVKAQFAENPNFGALGKFITETSGLYAKDNKGAIKTDITQRVMELANNAIIEDPELITDTKRFNSFKDQIRGLFVNEISKVYLKNVENVSKALDKGSYSKRIKNESIADFNEEVRAGEYDFAIDDVMQEAVKLNMGKTSEELEGSFSQAIYGKEYDELSYDYERAIVDINVNFMRSGNMYREALKNTFNIQTNKAYLDAANNRWVFEDPLHEGIFYFPGNLHIDQEGGADGIKWGVFTAKKVNGRYDFSTQGPPTFLSEYIDPNLYNEYKKALKKAEKKAEMEAEMEAERRKLEDSLDKSYSIGPFNLGIEKIQHGHGASRSFELSGDTSSPSIAAPKFQPSSNEKKTIDLWHDVTNELFNNILSIANGRNYPRWR